MRERVLVPLLLASLTCCDSSSGADPEWLASNALSPDLNRYFEAHCRNEERCSAGNSFRDCNSTATSLRCQPAHKQVKIKNLEACIKALETSECDAGYLPECFEARRAHRVASGNDLLAEGAACDGDERVRCDFDLYCDRPGDACGTCKRFYRLDEGETCVYDVDCKAGMRCQESVCRHLQAEGEECSENIDCKTELYCQDATCKARKAPGEPCELRDSGGGCLTACVDGQCVNFPIAARLGETCIDDRDCYSNTCEDGICIARPECRTAKEGERCAIHESCATGLVCSGRICVTPLKDGDTCDRAVSNCEADSSCNLDSRCQKRAKDGEACLSDGLRHCLSYFCNLESVCSAPEPLCEEEEEERDAFRNFGMASDGDRSTSGAPSNTKVQARQLKHGSRW
jgi:hypothetical protein